MDLKQIEYFVHVAELGSFTKAASLLSIAQPALSRQVRSLEVELEQTLLYRNGRGVSPTEAGKRLLAHGRGILQQVERARQEVEDVRGAPVGRVVLGLPPTVGKMLAVTLVAEFQARFPRAKLGIVEGLTTYVTEWLLMGRVDVALLHNPIASPALTLSPLMEEQLCLIGPATRGKTRSHAPVRMRDMPSYPLIIPSRPHAFRMQVDTQLANLGLKANVALEIDGVPAMLDLVHQGYGHAVLPANRVRVDNQRRAFVTRPIVEPRLASTLALAIPAQRPTTPLTRQTLELLASFVPRALRAGGQGVPRAP
ncbi:MAG: LysR family transcriptional regulator [Betaproteobacteria bacterium]|nr:LysR family transcriptional regulator [Betaproteobacteria bacterium]